MDIPFLRLMVGILFYPCFLVMNTGLPPEIYYTAAAILLYYIILYSFPALNKFLGRIPLLPLLIDYTLITLFIYYGGALASSLVFLYFFPLIAVALHNSPGVAVFALTAANGLYLTAAITNGLPLTPVVIQVILVCVGFFYVRLLGMHFHQTYYKQANQDTLTKINNRRFFNHTIEQLIQSRTPYSLILMDLDNFKALNDTQGHHHGDYVLKIVASIIKECVRSYDIVARYGGDEFTIILPHSSKEESRMIAERIRSSITVNPKLLPYSFISISQGIARFPDDADSLEGILEKADEALYTAKRLGKNCIHVS